MDVLLDGVHELRVLLGGVGVVHAQIADAAEFFSGAKVDDQRLAVADVKITVGFGRETGVDLHPGEPPSFGDILLDELVDKVLALARFPIRAAGGNLDLFRHMCPSCFFSRYEGLADRHSINWFILHHS